MESRYVLTKKLLEPLDIPKAQSEDLYLDDKSNGPCKAKCRHVMKGFSEAAALDTQWRSNSTGTLLPAAHRKNEGNKIAAEARKHKDLGIKVMPIP